jgi:hypothetical protein
VIDKPALVLEGVQHDLVTAAAHFAVSESGTLVHGPPNPPPRSHLAWVDAAGTLTRLAGPDQFRNPRLSPDSRRVAVCTGGVGACQLQVLDIAGRTLSRVAPELGVVHRPIWTPDGGGITVGKQELQDHWSLLTLAPAGSAPPLRLREGNGPIYPSAWTTDGRFMVVDEFRVTRDWDVWVLAVGAEGRVVGAPRDLAALRIREHNAVLSADDRWVAYRAR